jgi:hypothetical protein
MAALGPDTSATSPVIRGDHDEIQVASCRRCCSYGSCGASASATASAAGNVTVVNVAGDDAYTTFISESDCVETTVGIVAAHESTQQPPGNTVLVTPVFIRLAQFNTCTGTPLRELTGFHRLEKSSFQVSGRLRTANLTTTNFNLHDPRLPPEENQTDIAVTVDVTWSGTGPIGENRNTIQNIELGPDCRLTFQGTGLFRNAPALGSVSDGGTNFTPGPSVPDDGEGEGETQIGSFKSAALNIGSGCL